MRRGTTPRRGEDIRAGRVALACAGSGLLVLLWASALPLGGAGEPSPSPREAFAPELRLRRASTGLLASPRFVPVAAVALARMPGFSREEASALPAASRSEPPLAGVRLPLSSQETAPDGLPVSGMRCSREGQGFSCGSCRTDGDCPSGQGCVANHESRRFECLASECEDDAHCFPGSVCRAVTTGATGTLVRRCAPEGLRAEGEPCDSLPLSPTGSCREGLRCVNQVCTTPCSLEGHVRCEEGFVCTEGLDGPGCFPDCQRRGCPEGQHCGRVRDEDFQCLADARGDCQDTPCPEGERCNLRMSRGRATFWCARVCNPVLADTCSAGEVCGMGSATVSTCFQQCDPMAPDACQPGWSCSTVTEDMSVFGCTPALSP